MSTLLLSPVEIESRLRNAHRLIQQGRGADAAKITAALIDDPRAGSTSVALHAVALSVAGRLEEALPFSRRVVDAQPRDFGALIRLLALLDGLALYEEVDERASLAFSRGGKGAVLQLLHARALAGLGRPDDAERLLRATVASDPDFIEAHQGLANLVWSRTGDVDRALEALEEAILKTGETTPKLVLRAEVLSYAGLQQAAYDGLAKGLARPGADRELNFAASQMALSLNADLAARHAEAALAASGPSESAHVGLCEARLAQGRAEEAEAEADALLKLAPQNQHFLTLKATAERMQGKPGWAALYDYPAFVHAYALEAPTGWSDMAGFLRDLAAQLTELHTTQTHPVGQSLREGTQTTRNLLQVNDRAIKGLFRALDAPIRRYIAALGTGDDPVRRRNLGGYAYAGVWSVRLRAGGGRHADHVHPMGWLSSACYISVPAAARGEDKAGWITFGHAGTPTSPEMPAEHFVQPEPGKLVLFPSYMWHGVNRFEGDEPRLTVAFDLVPSATTPTFD